MLVMLMSIKATRRLGARRGRVGRPFLITKLVEMFCEREG
jgi:hypothetical protein